MTDGSGEIDDALVDACIKQYPDKMMHPREAFEHLCDFFGIKDMDINRIEVTAGLMEPAIVKVFHVGLNKTKTVTKYKLVKEHES